MSTNTLALQIALILLLQIARIAPIIAANSSHITDCTIAQSRLIINTMHKLTLRCSGADAAHDISANISSPTATVYCADTPLNVSAITHLNFDDCQMAELPPKLFRHFRRLRGISLQSLSLDALKADDLMINATDSLHEPYVLWLNGDLRFEHFTFISVAYNHLKRIDSPIFGHLRKLGSVDLSFNAIEFVSVDAFANLTDLRSLDLQHNRIRALPAGIFGDLDDLSELNLAQNQLDTFAGVFDEDSSLKSLDLSGNQLARLQTGDFVHLHLLHNLNVSRCRVEVIELGAITQLRILQTLDLSGNRLRAIDFGMFLPSLWHLQGLHLNDNRLTELSFQFNKLFPKLLDLVITRNRFNCTYLKQFFGSVSGVLSNSNVIKENRTNIAGVTCDMVDEHAPSGGHGDGKGANETSGGQMGTSHGNAGVISGGRDGHGHTDQHAYEHHNNHIRVTDILTVMLLSLIFIAISVKGAALLYKKRAYLFNYRLTYHQSSENNLAPLA